MNNSDKIMFDDLFISILLIIIGIISDHDAAWLVIFGGIIILIPRIFHLVDYFRREDINKKVR